MKRVLAVAHKELNHILRDPRSLVVAILMPLMMVVMYGYAIDMEMKQLKVAFLDLDRSAASRELMREFTSSGFILNAGSISSWNEIETGFRRSDYRAAVVIPERFAERLTNEPSSPVQIIVDGADGATGATGENYLLAVIARQNRRLATEAFGVERFPIEPQTRILYNPMLVSANYIVPGLVAVVLIMICALLTSIAVARERETGTLEQILTTPVSPWQVIVGKVVPYLGLGAIDTTLILLAGRWIFDIPMNGSWWVLAGYSLLYLLIALALGLMVSTIARTQQLAMMIALVGTMLPALLLSGFIFNISSMPWFLQQISRLIPATYFLRIIRGVMLKGDAWFPVDGGILLLMAIFAITVATVRFKGRLE
jgi:ABC-2 type transport system permease protein